MYITIHAQESPLYLDAWFGFVAVRVKGQNQPLYTVDCKIHRPNKDDALDDASRLQADMLQDVSDVLVN